MFARITHSQMKPDAIEAAKTALTQLKPKVMAMPGMIQFINTMNPDGSGCVVSRVESAETSNANVAAVGALWAQFADHLAAPPKASGFDAFDNWSN